MFLSRKPGFLCFFGEMKSWKTVIQQGDSSLELGLDSSSLHKSGIVKFEDFFLRILRKRHEPRIIPKRSQKLATRDYQFVCPSVADCAIIMMSVLIALLSLLFALVSL